MLANFVYAAERVDKVARNGNEIWCDRFGLFGDKIEIS